MSIVGMVKSQVIAIDKDQPVFNIKSLDDVMATSLSPRRFSTLLLGIFAGIALVIAAVGIYGVISYSVNQSTREIGIRMALGAQRGDVLRLIIGKGMLLAVIGVAVGLIASLFLTKLLDSMLFGVNPRDLVTFASVSLVLSLIAFVACLIPSRRATRVDPMTALRYE